MKRQGWDDYDRALDKGPMDFFWKALPAFLLSLAVLLGGLGLLGFGLGWFSETAQVAQEEFGPRALLAKYAWFKETAAQLDKKRADVDVYEGRLEQLKADYSGKPRSAWAREDREQSSIWASEVAGIKASYNQLASEYNAKMVEFHWRFAERGELPPGATEPLPREFKPYIEQ